ncbi:MAG: hypothetical protein SGPRY_000626 [Prymnesium sp.]
MQTSIHDGKFEEHDDNQYFHGVKREASHGARPSNNAVKCEDEDSHTFRAEECEAHEGVQPFLCGVKACGSPSDQTLAGGEDSCEVSNSARPPSACAHTATLAFAISHGLTSRAANGEALFSEGERAVLDTLQGLQASEVQLIARLIYVTGPWHRHKHILRYTYPLEASICALEAAGVLHTFSQNDVREVSLSILPCLVLDELRQIRRALLRAAKAVLNGALSLQLDEWEASPECNAKLERGTNPGYEGERLRKMLKVAGDNKEAVLSQLTDLVAVCPTLPLEQIIDSTLNASKNGKARRLSPTVVHLLLRALRLSERTTVPAMLRPPPYSRAMVAAYISRPARTSCNPINAPTPIFDSRLHFHLTEAAVELGVAVKCAYLAGAEGADRPSDSATASKWRAQACAQYSLCDVAAAFASVNALVQPCSPLGDVRSPLPPTLSLSTDTEAAAATARNLAEQLVAPLRTFFSSPSAKYAQTLECWARRFEAGALLARAVFIGVRLIERSAEKARKVGDAALALSEYGSACETLQLLLACETRDSQLESYSDEPHVAGVQCKGTVAPSQAHLEDSAILTSEHITADDSSDVHGECYTRLLIDLKHMEALGDPNASSLRGRVLQTARMQLPEGSSARWEVEASAGVSWWAPPCKYVVEKNISGRIGAMGSRLLLTANDGTEQLVEHYVGQLLSDDEQGGWTYIHDEGRSLRELFGLLLHEEIFCDIPDVFFAPFQGAPLDLRSPHFYAARQAAIDARLQQLADSSPCELAQIVRLAHDKHYGECSGTVCWGEVRWSHRVKLQVIAVCFGGRSLAGILLHLAVTGMYSGMPDNTLVKASRPTNGEMRRVGGVVVEPDRTEPHSWPLVERGGQGRVTIKLVQTHLPCCVTGAEGLSDGAAVELRAERNSKAPGGNAMAVHLAGPGSKCGYVANADLQHVREGVGRVIRNPAFSTCVEGSCWFIEAPEAMDFDIVVGDDWDLRAALLEVKSRNDALWAEQRIWLRSLLERDFLRYDNPYLFTAHGQPNVDIGVCRVRDEKSPRPAMGGHKLSSGRRSRGQRRVVAACGGSGQSKPQSVCCKKPRLTPTDRATLRPARAAKQSPGSSSADAIDLCSDDSDADFQNPPPKSPPRKQLKWVLANGQLSRSEKLSL